MSNRELLNFFGAPVLRRAIFAAGEGVGPRDFLLPPPRKIRGGAFGRAGNGARPLDDANAIIWNTSHSGRKRL
jgi:hypothetical protein